MTRSDSSPLPDPEAEIAEAYRAHYPLLEFLAIQKFHVPAADVPDVIHEVVVAFIRSRPRIFDERAWLVGAACNVSRLYWREQSREHGVVVECDSDLEAKCAPDDIVQRLDVSAMLRRLPRRCREVLRLRFFEEYSSQELAAHFETTIAYARKMVYQCVGAARSLLVRERRRSR
ncbi:MAG TPA: sigma-70 family RNA polymerase sigma factor [Thermoanaerobaculia bacterium]|nr:sigma-70 family RNA polymerase sigma factor [Thermoanaerobaculia bacterium]